MPHIVVKLWPGKSEAQKQDLAEAITNDVREILGSKLESISVAFEEIDSAEWKAKVYDPEIKGKALYKKPGYEM